LNTYDVMFIFPATKNDEEFTKLQEAVTGEITRLGGTIERTDKMGRRSFARILGKASTDGLYLRLWIKLEATAIDPLLARFRLNEDIFRVQVRRLEGGVPPPAPPRAPSDSRSDSAMMEAGRYGEP